MQNQPYFRKNLQKYIDNITQLDIYLITQVINQLRGVDFIAA